MISTGGTISMQVDESGLAKPKLGAKELIEGLTDIGDDIEIEDIEFKNIPSPHLTLRDLVELKSIIEDTANMGFDGIVVTHGTDTMEETAYFLELTLDIDIPVVLTGAQRNSSSVSSDVGLNIMDSIMVASDDKAAEMGVVVVFCSEVILAREVIKTHRTRVDTFKSLEFGPVATIINNKVMWFRTPLIRDKYRLGDLEKMVDIIPSYLGSDSRLIRNSIRDKVHGIVIEGVGAGHVPKLMLDGIEEAIKMRIPVALSSRILQGRLLTDTYGYEGAEKQLRKMGVIFAEDLPVWKARIKLLVLLSLDYDNDRIKYEFEHNFY